MIVFGHRDVIDTAVHKIGDFVVDFLRELEAIFETFYPRTRGPIGIPEAENLVSGSLSGPYPAPPFLSNL
jgi:hypothetical protein